MATICVALGYDLLPGIQHGTWAQRTEHLASGATVLSRGARWRGDFVLDNTRLDPHFHHRKFHKLLALAGFAAVAFRGLSCHTMFGVASRRDKLTYVQFEEPVVAYGPPGLAGMTDVLCSGLTFSLCVEIDIPVQNLTRYELPAVRHLNAGVQARYTAKNTPENPGPFLINLTPESQAMPQAKSTASKANRARVNANAWVFCIAFNCVSLRFIAFCRVSLNACNAWFE